MAFVVPVPVVNGTSHRRPRDSRGPQLPRLQAVRSALRIVLLGVLAAGALGAASPARTGAEGREYEFKAAYVYNFIKFVDWPAQRLPASSTTINVCVVGKEAYRAAFDTINGKPVKGKTIIVSQYSGPQDVSRCHVFFVGDSETTRLSSLLEGSRTAGVLTVGDSSSFAREGGIIRFRNENNKIRFDINTHAAEESGLSISSQLLKLARIVQ